MIDKTAKATKHSLRRVVEALDKLTIGAVHGADDESLHKLVRLTYHWHEIAAHERAKRAREG